MATNIQRIVCIVCAFTFFARADTLIGEETTAPVKEDTTIGEDTRSENDDDGNTYTRITTSRYSNYVGIAGGYITGYGFSYRRWFKDTWGMQVTLFPMVRMQSYPEDYDDSYNDYYYYEETRDSGYYKQADVSAGLTLLRSFLDGRYVRFLGYSGANLLVNIDKFDYWTSYQRETSSWDPPDTIVTRHTRDRREISLGGGLGAGVEFYVWRFGFSVLLGIRGLYEFETTDYEVTPSVDGGLFFRF